LQSLNPCSWREGGRSLTSYFLFLFLPTWVNLLSFLTCEPEEFSASDNGKLLSWGWGRRRGDGENVREVGLAGEIKYPPEFLAGKLC